MIRSFRYLSSAQMGVLRALKVTHPEQMKKRLGALLPVNKEYAEKYPVTRSAMQDESLRVMEMLHKQAGVTYRNWFSGGWWGDQLLTSQCVAYTGLHLLEDGPVPQGGSLPAPIIAPSWLYKECQRNDEWPGEEPEYEGTSVNAMFKILKREGYIKEYKWATDAETVKEWILNVGPVALGISWDFSMFFPDSKYIIHPDGDSAGGHALLANGYNDKTKLFRLKNSWGREWGNQGHCYISMTDLDAKIKDYGEAGMPIELKKAVAK